MRPGARLPDGVLLAAGSGSRFGTDKLLAPLVDGTPLALAALAPLRAVLPRVVAVVRPGAERLAALLEAAGAEVTACPYAADGMGASLAWGVRHCGGDAGWVVALADMPWIRIDTVRKVAERIALGDLAATPQFQGRRGHPVGFSAQLRGELQRLSGDTGARLLLATYCERVTLVQCDDPGVLQDVDVPADLRS